MHLNSFIPGTLRAICAGIDAWLEYSGRRFLEEATIVVTDSVEFAHEAAETNTIVVLVSSGVETVPSKIQVTHPNKEEIHRAIYSGCAAAFT